MAFRPQIYRTTRKGKEGRFAKGKHAVGICHRSGFKVPYIELKFEPGTSFLVHRSENDWENSLVTHPQNFPPEKKIERIALRWSFGDSKISVGSVVSAKQLFLPSHASVSNQFIQYAQLSISTGVSIVASVGTGVSDGLLFNSVNNSMYYLIIFPGI